MADIRNKHASLPGHKMPMETRVHYEDLTDSIIPVYPIYIQATQCGVYKISFADHAKSMRNRITRRSKPIKNKSFKSEATSPFTNYNGEFDYAKILSPWH